MKPCSITCHKECKQSTSKESGRYHQLLQFQRVEGKVQNGCGNLCLFDVTHFLNNVAAQLQCPPDKAV